MPLTVCVCTLSIKDLTGTAYSTAELVWDLRKSMVDSGTGLYVSKPVRATAVAGVCTLSLVETTTDNQQGVFTLNWDTAGGNSGSIVFDPIKIPNAASVDLSTILTVSRG